MGNVGHLYGIVYLGCGCLPFHSGQCIGSLGGLSENERQHIGTPGVCTITGYITGPHGAQSPPTTIYPRAVGRPEENDDEDPEEDPVDYPVDGGDDGDDEDESSEDDEDDDEVDIELYQLHDNGPICEGGPEPFKTERRVCQNFRYILCGSALSIIRSPRIADRGLGPAYKVRESSFAAAARPAGGLRADYGFVATMDREIRCDPERDVGYRITDSQDTNEIYTRLDDEQSGRQLLAGQLNMLFKDRHAHAHTTRLMETEARMSREAWG
ncbi:hypothetical protein Tco_1193525 [Tanacetum coccineum]